MEEGRESNFSTDELPQSESDNSPELSESESYNFDKLQIIKVDNPLAEAVIQQSLKKMNISGSQLINMSVKELNKCLAEFPVAIASKLKRCRRTLKNRGYAKNCRIKRIAAKNHLERLNTKLMIENRELRQSNKSLVDQLNHLQHLNQSNSVEVARVQCQQQSTSTYQVSNEIRYECKQEPPVQVYVADGAQYNLDYDCLIESYSSAPSFPSDWIHQIDR